MSAVCTWIVDPGCQQDIWDAATPQVQAAAAEFATLIMWSATGRQFTSCPITVRPCLRNGEWGWFRYNNGWDYGGSGWVPFIWNGQWFNGCGSCGNGGPFCCAPRWNTQALLEGPVYVVDSVVIGGLVVPPTSYRVDDAQWLVRTDGGQWPIHQDLNEDAGGTDTWTVTYQRGKPVPKAALTAAGTLATEYIKMCSGGECRLSGRVTSIIRAGVEMTMVDPTSLLERGLTGLEDVDLVIRALNPLGLAARLRVYSPDIEQNRVTTWQSP